MFRTFGPRHLWLVAVLVLLLLGSWKLLLPHTTPTAVAPPGAFHRVQDTP